MEPLDFGMLGNLILLLSLIYDFCSSTHHFDFIFLSTIPHGTAVDFI